MRPIALYRWDLEYPLDVLSMALDDRKQYPSQHSKAYSALHERFKQEYDSPYR